MIDYLARPVIHEAFYKKYASKKFLKASLYARTWALRNHQTQTPSPDAFTAYPRAAHAF